jgi:uncharacterized YigZ family protein
VKRSLKKRSTTYLEIDKSKFIGFAAHIEKEGEIDGFLSRLKAEYPKARHYCSAFVLGNLMKINEDKEPSGTFAGPFKKMVDLKKIDGIFLLIIRYFGGIKLGKGRLTRTYATVMNELLKEDNLKEYSLRRLVSLSLSNESYYSFMKIVNKNSFRILKEDFNDRITLLVEIAPDLDITSLIGQLTDCQISSDELSLGLETE